MATLFERIKKIVIDQLGVEEERVIPEASFVEDLEADSLDLVEIVMAIEDEFSKGGEELRIPDEDAENLKTIQDVVDYLKSRNIADE